MKLDTYELGNQLKQLGFDFYSGVPCSFLKDLINYAINEVSYVMSANEGDAVATCAGAFMAGKKSVVLMQNSGLTNATSPLTSLNYSFKIPVLGFVSLRGEKGLNDEPQHELMGQITEKMLELSDVKWEYLSNDIAEVKKQLKRANKCIDENKTFFFIVKKGVLDKVILKPKESKIILNQKILKKELENELPLRLNVLETLSENKGDDTILLASTGKAGRELYEIDDAKNNFYMVGSMGCISAIGLGLALSQKNKKVIAIDGDGSLLMRMENLATNAAYSPDNLLHIVIDNNLHDSTGGQFTISHNIDFVNIAASCGYIKSLYIHSLDELSVKISEWKKKPVLTFLYIKVKKGTKDNLGRPKITPVQVKNRLMEFINE